MKGVELRSRSIQVRRFPKPALLITAAIILAACEKNSRPPSPADTPAFTQTDESAVKQLLATQYVAALRRAIPNRRLICMVDFAGDDGIHVYLADEGIDFAFRIGFYRVTPDGQVWINQDVTDLDDRWAVIE